jgi:probable O-glycosylation ligase (exosortase A-associated)
MIRSVLPLALLVVGIYYASRGPFFALLVYFANAYFRPETYAWGDSLARLNLSLLIGISVIALTFVARQKLVWNGRVTLVWLFLGLSLFSSLASGYSDYSWPFAVEFLKIITVTYLLVILTDDSRKFRLVILMMVMSLGLEQAKQGWFYLLTSPGWRNDNPIPFLGDNNGTAVGMLMLVPLVGLLMQTTKGKWRQLFFGIVLIGCLYRALSTFSRGAFLASIAVAIVLSLRSANKLRNLAIILGVSLLILPMLPSVFWDRMETIQTYKEINDESALGRLHFWSVAMRMASANPIIGVGFNSYNRAYDEYDFSGGGYGRGYSVHSIYFGVLAELGYLGLFLYLSIIFSAFRASSYSRKVGFQREHRFFVVSASALEASLVAFLVGGSFVPLQYNEMFWHIIGLLIVLMRLAGQHQEPATAEICEYKGAAAMALNSQVTIGLH